MANRQRDPVKEAYWRKVLRRHAASGLSVRAFCRREALSEPSLYAWRRTIRERDGQAKPPIMSRPAKALAFVPAVVTASPLRDASIAIELPGGGVLRFSGPLAAQQLAELVVALQSRSER